MTVRQLPPREFFKSLVSLESLNGIWPLFAFIEFSYSILMQLPRARSDLLIFAPSTILIPLFPVDAALSDPAKSIKDSIPTFFYIFELLVFSTLILNTACDLLDVLLAKVTSYILFLLPSKRRSRISSELCTTCSERPATIEPSFGSSRRSSVSGVLTIRSRMVSL